MLHWSRNFIGIAKPDSNKKGSGGPLPSGIRCVGKRLLGGFRRVRHDRDELAPADPVLKFHIAGFEREQRVVAPHPDALARVKLAAALPHDDVAGNHDLAAELLDAEAPA